MFAKILVFEICLDHLKAVERSEVIVKYQVFKDMFQLSPGKSQA